jgi:hypothetical protein
MRCAIGLVAVLLALAATPALAAVHENFNSMDLGDQTASFYPFQWYNGTTARDPNSTMMLTVMIRLGAFKTSRIDPSTPMTLATSSNCRSAFAKASFSIYRYYLVLR